MAKLTAIFIVAAATSVVCLRKREPVLTKGEDGIFRYDDTKKQYNPYPELCVEKKDMTDNEKRILNMCILKEKFAQEVTVPLEKRYARQLRAGGVLVNFVSARPSEDAGDEEDCLYSQRFAVRPFPGVCRTKKFNKPNASQTWDALFKEIQGDFSYMWDYVLWDEQTPERKENQLWYLILYLKTLASMIGNPLDFTNLVRATPKDDEFLAQIEKVERKFKRFSEKMIAALRKALGKDNQAFISKSVQMTFKQQLGPEVQNKIIVQGY